MTYDEFVGQVQHRARLATTGSAVHVIHATLQTLGERLTLEEGQHLAAQLPREIGAYLTQVLPRVSFTLREFYQRVALREQAELPDAVYHAKAVVSVLVEAVSTGEIADVRAQLSSEFDDLFHYEGEGGMRKSA